MLKKSGITILLLVTSFVTLLAQDLPKASVEVSADFVSNYVWRGGDIFGASIADQQARNQDGKIQAWAFQPSITFITPVEGLSFNIWGSFATRHRQDTDSDQLIQQGPGGSSIEFNEALVTAQSGDASALSSSAGTTLFTTNSAGTRVTGIAGVDSISFHHPECEDATAVNCVPNFYKEKNGLHRLDEIDYTLDYTRETTVGTMSFGIIYYTLPHVTAKADAFEEVYVGYALPQLPDLSLTIYTDVTSGASSNNYILLAYGSDFEISDGVALTYGASTGYGIKSRLQGIQDVTGSIGVDVQGFFVKFNVAHRPDTRFFDEDSSEAPNLALFGLSSRSDGLIADKSQTTGFANSIINATVNAAIDSAISETTRTDGYTYTYTPRQKIPSEIYWVSLGYTFEI